ncbi:hypothetical protein TNCV_1778761 [Trichonephila clavipes]|nr:hypothetical protein TNCV_1778761 [Trichonephila clavipes]
MSSNKSERVLQVRYLFSSLDRCSELPATVANSSFWVNSVPLDIPPLALVLHQSAQPRWPSGQGIGSWLASHEFEPSTTKDPPCKGAMHVRAVKSSNVLQLE